MNLRVPFFDALIPNQPDIKTNAFTLAMLNPSINHLKAVGRGETVKSSGVGRPDATKLACSSRTINIETFRSSSMFDSLLIPVKLLLLRCISFIITLLSSSNIRATHPYPSNFARLQGNILFGHHELELFPSDELCERTRLAEFHQSVQD